MDHIRVSPGYSYEKTGPIRRRRKPFNKRIEYKYNNNPKKIRINKVKLFIKLETKISFKLQTNRSLKKPINARLARL